MGIFISDMLQGVSVGMLYFLIAAGLTLVMGILGIVNFAHGAMYMIGAYVGWTVVQGLGSAGYSFLISCIISAIVLGAFAIFVEVILFRRIYQAEHLYQLILTFGLALFLEGLTLQVWGAEAKAVALPDFLHGSVGLYGLAFPVYLVFILIVSTFLAILLWLFLHKTRLGKECRAAAMDREVSETLGINVRKVLTTIFCVGGALAGLGGVLGVGLKSLNLGIGTDIVVTCFVIIVVGGMGRLEGALVAGILLGLLESFGGHYFQQLSMAFPFILMALVLVLRPQGLLGKGA